MLNFIIGYLILGAVCSVALIFVMLFSSLDIDEYLKNDRKE